MNMYDPYNPYNPYNSYNPYGVKVPSKGGAWAVFIIASILAAVDLWFWLPVYHACTDNGHQVLAYIQGNVKDFALFAGFFAGFLLFSIIAFVKFCKCAKFWGVGFGTILGRIFILLEYAAYAFAILCLFF